MFELQILIPLWSNEGVAFTEAHHAQFERAIVERFGGVSRLRETIAGQWASESQLFHDELRAYTIAVSSITEGDKIRELVGIAKAHYRQEAIYVRYLGQAEIL